MNVWQKFLISLFDTKDAGTDLENPILEVLVECKELFPSFRVSFWSINARKNEIKIYALKLGKLVASEKALSQFKFEKQIRSKTKPFYSFHLKNSQRVLIPLFVDGNLSGCVAVSSGLKTTQNSWKLLLPYFFIQAKRLLKWMQLSQKNNAIDTLMELNLSLEDQVREKARSLEQEKSAHLQASKMATLGEVAAGIAHEINNPLTIIVSRVNLLERNLEKKSLLNPELVDSFNKINLTVERIVKIINGLRYFAHNGSGKKANVVVSRIISDSLDLCQERLKKNEIELKVVKPVFDVEISAHDTQIIQVLLNLIINSLDAIKDLSEKWIEIEYKIENDHLRVTVRDSGHGLTSEIANKIMTPFYTTKDKGQGTGLGLSLSKTIIENHEGRLFYNSESKNTEFVIELPYMRTI